VKKGDGNCGSLSPCGARLRRHDACPPHRRRTGGAGHAGLSLRHVDLAPFARDEPQFLRAAGDQLRTGHWLSANPLYGNLGLRYGPTAFWFYGVEQALLGPDPRLAIVAMGLTVTLAHLGLAFALWRLFGGGPVFLAVLVAWVASSPDQFLWSRLAWDLTSNVFRRRPSCVRIAAGWAARSRLGTVSPGISTHPMLVPFAMAAVVVGWARRGRAAPAAAALVGSAFLVNVPISSS
jgi:hypothetical protein